MSLTLGDNDMENIEADALRLIFEAGMGNRLEDFRARPKLDIDISLLFNNGLYHKHVFGLLRHPYWEGMSNRLDMLNFISGMLSGVTPREVFSAEECEKFLDVLTKIEQAVHDIRRVADRNYSFRTDRDNWIMCVKVYVFGLTSDDGLADLLRDCVGALAAVANRDDSVGPTEAVADV